MFDNMHELMIILRASLGLELQRGMTEVTLWSGHRLSLNWDNANSHLGMIQQPMMQNEEQELAGSRAIFEHLGILSNNFIIYIILWQLYYIISKKEKN